MLHLSQNIGGVTMMHSGSYRWHTSDCSFFFSAGMNDVANGKLLLTYSQLCVKKGMISICSCQRTVKPEPTNFPHEAMLRLSEAVIQNEQWSFIPPPLPSPKVNSAFLLALDPHQADGSDHKGGRHLTWSKFLSYQRVAVLTGSIGRTSLVNHQSSDSSLWRDSN